MESLTAFFILEGLTFDMIGAYLIVTSVFPRKIIITPQYAKLFAEFMFGNALPIYFKIMKNQNNDLTWGENKDKINKLIDDDPKIKELKAKFEIEVSEEKEKQQKELTVNRAYGGLSFLIAGFLLQGIGIVTQLFYQ